MPACGEAAFFAGAVKVESGDSSARAFSGGGRSSPPPSLTRNLREAHPSGRPAFQAGRVRRRKGRGSPPIPWPSVFTATGWRPARRSRSGRGRRPPRRRLPAFGAGSPFHPAPGADGTTVRASQPPGLARREAGGGRGRHAPEAAGRQTRTRAAADGSDTVRPASLAGPVRPALVSIRRVGLGEGRSSPWSWGVQRGGACSTPLRVSRHECSQCPSNRRGGHPPSRWTTPSGSPRPSRTCEPVSPAATASGLRNMLLSNLGLRQDGRGHDRARVLGVDAHRPPERGKATRSTERWPPSSRPGPYYRWPPRKRLT